MMLTRSLTEATLSDLSAIAVPPQSLPQISDHGFSAKRMDAITGRALECLAHAMEYIEETKSSHTDHAIEAVAADQAIRILKELNCQIFAELPNLPERRSLLRLIVQKWEFSRLEVEGVASVRQKSGLLSSSS